MATKKEDLKNYIDLKDEEVVELAQGGNGAASDFLIDKYKDMAKTIAQKYYITGADREDVVQEGMIGIFKAIRNYSLGEGSAFKSFAYLCIERQIQTAVTVANREKHKILNESLSLDGDSDEDNSKVMGVPGSKSLEPEKITLIKETVEELEDQARTEFSPLEQRVFSGMMQGKTYKEIAAELGKPAKSIDNAMQRIKRKISLLD